MNEPRNRSGRAILWESSGSKAVVTSVAVAGDFLPAGKLIRGDASPFSALDWGRMAAPLAPSFDDVDTAFVNCETTLNSGDLVPRRLNGLGEIVAAPEQCLDYLAAIRANVVGLANNHSYDFGPSGVERTRGAIERRTMVPLGAARDLRSSPEVFVWRGPGRVRVGFWAAARATSDGATHRSKGVELATLARAVEALDVMRQKGARFRIALLHAGCLRTNYPDPEDVRLINGIARSGFDLVAASHSHRISGGKLVNRTNNTPAFCFYGLGTLVSGYAASPSEREGLVVIAGFGADGAFARIEVRPVLLAENGFGAVPTAEESGAIVRRFQVFSEEIAAGSYAQLFYRDVSRGLIDLYARDVRKAFQEAGLRGLAHKARRIRMRHVRRLVYKVLG